MGGRGFGIAASIRGLDLLCQFAAEAIGTYVGRQYEAHANAVRLIEVAYADFESGETDYAGFLEDVAMVNDMFVDSVSELMNPTSRELSHGTVSGVGSLADPLPDPLRTWIDEDLLHGSLKESVYEMPLVRQRLHQAQDAAGSQ